MEQEKKDRLKKVAMTGLALAIGSAALKKDIRTGAKVKTVRFLEASKEVWIEIIEDGTMNATKLVGIVKHGPGGPRELEDIDVLEDIELSDSQVDELEMEFPPSLLDQNNTLQES